MMNVQENNSSRSTFPTTPNSPLPQSPYHSTPYANAFAIRSISSRQKKSSKTLKRGLLSIKHITSSERGRKKSSKVTKEKKGVEVAGMKNHHLSPASFVLQHQDERCEPEYSEKSQSYVTRLENSKTAVSISINMDGVLQDPVGISEKVNTKALVAATAPTNATKTAEDVEYTTTGKTTTAAATTTTTIISNASSTTKDISTIKDFFFDQKPIKTAAEKEADQKRKAATRAKWRNAIQRIAKTNSIVRVFEEPIIKRKRLNLTRALSQSFLVGGDVKKKKKKSIKQRREEETLQTVVRRFRLRRKESYGEDSQKTKKDELKNGKDNGENKTTHSHDEDIIEELEENDPTNTLPPGFGRGLNSYQIKKSTPDDDTKSTKRNNSAGSDTQKTKQQKNKIKRSISMSSLRNSFRKTPQLKDQKTLLLTNDNNGNTISHNNYGDDVDVVNTTDNGIAVVEKGKGTDGDEKYKDDGSGDSATLGAGGTMGMTLGNRQMSKRAEFELALKHAVLHPSAPFKQGWDFFMFVLIGYLMIAIPYQVAFAVSTPVGEPPSFFDIWDQIVDALFWFDIFLSFNTAYHHGKTKQLIVSRKEIAKSYLKLWFWIDLLAAIPIDRIITGVIMGGSNNALKMLKGVRLLRQIRMLKLLRLMRIAKILRQKKKGNANFTVSRSAHALKMFKLVSVVLFLAHFLACLWYSFSNDLEPSSGFLAWEKHHNPHMSIYLRTLYHTTAMLISDQGGVEPYSDMDLIFCTLCMLMGSVVISVVFGQMALIISNMNAQKSEFQRKMERLGTSMKYLGLPQALQQRIFRYYIYLWEQHRSIDGKLGSFVEELSENLSAEVTIYLRHKVIATNLIFSKCYAEELHDIVLSLKRSFYLPGDYIIRQGAIGRGLYLIHSGETDVLVTREIVGKKNGRPENDEDDDEEEEENERTIRLSILGPGAHFGSKNLWRRNPELASVVARTNCEILILDRKKFAWLCAKHKGLTDRVDYDAHSDSPTPHGDSVSGKGNKGGKLGKATNVTPLTQSKSKREKINKQTHSGG